MKGLSLLASSGVRNIGQDLPTPLIVGILPGFEVPSMGGHSTDEV